jgi:flagellar basal body-associated protein FliL
MSINGWYTYTMARIHSILIFIALTIFIIIAGTTIFVFAARPSNIGSNLRHADPSAEKLIKGKTYYDQTSVYSQLGRLRAATADDPSVSVIVTPYFPYPSNDDEFYEELSLKNRKIKLLIIEYFSEHSAEQLKKDGELKIKNDLLTLINEELVIGDISALFFEEFIILD